MCLYIYLSSYFFLASFQNWSCWVKYYNTRYRSTAFRNGCTNLSLALLENEARFSALSLEVGMIMLLNLSQHYRYNTGSRSCVNQYVTV